MTTLAELVTDARQHTEARLDDEFAGVTYWTNAQIEDKLAVRSIDLALPLVANSTMIGGVQNYRVQYFKPYLSSIRLIAPYRLLDNLTNEVDPLLYVVSESYKRVTLDASLTNVQYVLLATGYSMYDVYADIWAVKASQRAHYIQTRAGTHQSAFQQEYEHCVKQELYYRAKRVRGFRR